MKRTLKISGKKHAWSEPSAGEKQAWRFERRPGGWIIGIERLPDGSERRTRLFYSRMRAFFSAKIRCGRGSDLRGEQLAVSRGSASAGDADYTAQFPGKVRKIAAKLGESVKEGTPLLMIEAMKMEFAIKAGADGRVKKFHVVEGQQLSPGQNLLDFEANPNE